MISIKLMDMHNHTIWSDGINNIDEIIQDAISKGISSIGITDHFNPNHELSLKLSQLSEYINEINKLRDKYKKNINVFSGIEVKATPYPLSFEKLPYSYMDNLDFILIENLEFMSTKITLKDLEKYIKYVNCSIGLAHTDLFRLALSYKEKGGINYVISFLKENCIFWEINTNGAYECFDELLYYDNSKEVQYLIEKLIKNNIKVTVGSDKHSLDDFELGRFLKGNEIANYINGGGRGI